MHSAQTLFVDELGIEYIAWKSHLKRGHRPRLDKAVDPVLAYVIRCQAIHGDTYDYSKTIYSKSRSKVIITCRAHGDFEQAAFSHLQGIGCAKCGYQKKSDTYTGRNISGLVSTSPTKKCILYALRCFNDDEEFIKIGITTQTIERRYRGYIAMPYNYEVVRELNMIVKDALSTESRIISNNKDIQYNPRVRFAGHTECFEKKVLKYLEK